MEGEDKHQILHAQTFDPLKFFIAFFLGVDVRERAPQLGGPDSPLSEWVSVYTIFARSSGTRFGEILPLGQNFKKPLAKF